MLEPKRNNCYCKKTHFLCMTIEIKSRWNYSPSQLLEHRQKNIFWPKKPKESAIDRHLEAPSKAAGLATARSSH